MSKATRVKTLSIVLGVFVVLWTINTIFYVVGALSAEANNFITNQLSWAAMVATVGTLLMEAITQREVEEDA